MKKNQCKTKLKLLQPDRNQSYIEIEDVTT